MRQFYRLKFDLGRFRDVSGDPVWVIPDFYRDVDGESRAGSLDLSNTRFEFDPTQSLPIADFNDAGRPSCSLDLYNRLFRDLLDPFVVKFPCRIDAEDYVLFRPNTFLDLVDLDRSRYLERASRGPYAFREIALRAEPPEDVPIFAIEPPASLRHQIIVDDRFFEIVQNHRLTGLIFQKVLRPASTSRSPKKST